MKSNQSPIAIIGLSSLFPAASNIQTFWDNILYGVDAIQDVPESHWKIEDYYDPDPTAEDKTYCKRGGFIPPTAFNPVEFGIPPNVLDVTDVLQLLSLNVAKSALFDAGYHNNSQYESVRERTGVVLGITGANSLTQPLSNRLQSPKLRQVLQKRGLNEAQITDVLETFKKSFAPWEENSFPGMLGNVVSGRIANRFDMGGINCTIDAACASSLAALRMAIDELHCGRADLMLTGGCDAENTILMFMCFSKTPAFSQRGVISPFDAESDGTLIGEGMGMLALKRLADAERDGDQIYALIKGLGASSDGKFKSIYAPRKEGQIRCLQRAYDDAACSIQSIGLLEAHGTGTKVGDATEVSALEEVVGSATSKHIALGSVKSQIGHTKAAAGAAGLIKMTLALHHKVLPPTLNITRPSEQLMRSDSPLYVNSQARPWFLSYPSEKRRGGISSFGFGGTNFHAVLEEYDGANRRMSRLHRVGQPSVIGAESLSQLKNTLQLISDTGEIFTDIASAAVQPYRLGFVCRDSEEAKQKAELAMQHLERVADAQTWHHPKGIFFSQRARANKVAALFSGQGSQYVDMAKQACMAFEEYRHWFERADRHLFSEQGEYLSAKVFPSPVYSAEEQHRLELNLRETQYAQPAIGMVSAASFNLLRQAGLQVNCVGGHSFGELTALWAASVLPDEHYTALAIARGNAMKASDNNADTGVMAAVAASAEQVKTLLSKSGFSEVYLCNLNTPEQTVIGGATEHVKQFLAFVSEKQIKNTLLPVSAAFHTPLVQYAQEQFAKHVEALEFNKAAVPVYRNLDGLPIESANELKQNLKQQLLQPVKFVDMINRMLQDGVDTFIEFGPKGSLAKMVADITAGQGVEATTIAVDNGKAEHSAEQLSLALVQLAVAGIAVNSLNHLEPTYRDAPEKAGFKVELNGINYVSERRHGAWLESLEPDIELWQGREAGLKDDLLNNTETAQSITVGIEKPLAEPLTEYSDQAMPLSPSSQVISADDLTLQVEQPLFENKPSLQNSPAKAEVFSPSSAASLSYSNPIIDRGPRVQSKISDSQLDFLYSVQSDNAKLHDHFLQQSTEVTQQTLNMLQGFSQVDTASLEQFGAMQQLAQQGMQMVAENQSYTAQSHQAFLKSTIELAAAAIARSQASLGVKVQDVPLREQPLQAVGSDAQALRLPTAPQPISNNTAAAPSVGASTPRSNVISMEAALSGPVAQPFSPEKPAPSVKAEGSVLSVEEVTQHLMAIVAEKTGYPVDVLDPTMNIESDLGIDSIKRVEILGALQKLVPQAESFQPETLAEVSSLEDIIAAVCVTDSGVKDSGVNMAAPPSRENEGATTETSPAASGVNFNLSVNATEVKQRFLAVVAEKTGYPEDVLEMSMSLETDLGIDSIKRVEILGELQKQFALEGAFNPQEMAELSTLGDISQYIEGATASGNKPVNAVTISKQPPAEPETMNTATNLNLDEVRNALLEIVSEKTGYPLDVIDMEMDLEADLGIDSIKRVEILGGLQARQPGLPAPEASMAGELRNLQQIMDFVAVETAQAPAVVEDLNALTEFSAQTEHSAQPKHSDAGLPPIAQHQVSLKKLSSVNQWQACFPEHAQALVVVGEPLQTVALYSALQKAGFTVTLLVLPGFEIPEQLQAQSQSVQVKDWKESSLWQVLETLPEMDLVLYQHPQLASDIAELNAKSQDIRSLKHLLLLAKFYKLALDKPTERRKAFITLSRMDGQLGLGTANTAVLAAACFGLIKTLAMETEYLFCRALDIQPAIEPEALAQHVITEIIDVNAGVTDVGITKSERVTFAVEPINTFPSPISLAEDTCFIVTGGARGITAACIQNLAQRQAGKYLLLGRTPLVEEPSWAKGVAENSLKARAAEQLKQEAKKPLPKVINEMVNHVLGAREIHTTLQSLAGSGVEARYVALDICDEKAVAQWAETDEWLASAENLAIVHGAGALADRLIESKQLADVNRVFSVKLYALSNLIANIDRNKLNMLALFSSVAGLFGNVGQVDYAMANEVLNRIAMQFHQGGTRAVSLVWGAWDAGMVTAEIKKMFQSRGIALIDVQEGAKLFSDACLNPEVPALNMVGPSGGLSSRPLHLNRYKQLKRELLLNTAELSSSDLLLDHRISGKAVLPASFAFGWLANIVEEMFCGAKVQACERMRVNKGLVFDNSAPKTLALNVQAEAVDAEGNLLISAQISAVDSHQAYYQFNGIKLSTQALPNQAVLKNIEAVSLAPDAKAANTFYNNKTLFHGKHFQMLEKYQSDAHRGMLFSSCWAGYAEDNTVSRCRGTNFCPMYGDALLQAALVWVKEYQGSASLPMLIEQVSCEKSIPVGETVFIKVEPVEQSDTNTTLRVSALSAQGELYVSMLAGVVLSAALAEKFSA